MISKEDRERLFDAMLESEEIKTLYKDYIIKEIPFETWVRNTIDRLWVKSVVNDHLDNNTAR